MKTRLKKHVAHYALAMIGLGLSALTHAADAPGAISAGNLTQSIAVDTDNDTPAWANTQYARWRWNPGYLISSTASVSVNGVTVFDQPNASYQSVTTARVLRPFPWAGFLHG